ncbi:putative F-box protein At1g19160 [Lycium barbarum]|uniref:putative F-box protein At1g19160 n=1 Tax=Lycium barbarum TaxID=112863 RepID=UPI00293E5110|nr:putative F-box protein At1g19160 [Lycium barbarum]
MHFKCVYKFCNSLVSESDFVDIHQCRSMIRTGGKKLFAWQDKDFYTIEGKEEGNASRLRIENFSESLLYNHIMCTNGLFCCSKKYEECVAICNPSTKVVRYLPRLKEFAKIDYPGYYYSMGFDPQEKTYKVLMTVSTRNWVFTLGTDKSWREIKGIIDFAVTRNNAVYISGVIYMLSYAEGNAFIVAFDVKNENFRIITLWNSSYHRAYFYNTRKVNGKLAILDMKNQTQNEGWEKHIIRIPLERTRFCNYCDGEILFTKTIKSRQFIRLCYDDTEKRWREFIIKGLPEVGLVNGVYSYAESLFLVEKICNSS